MPPAGYSAGKCCRQTSQMANSDIKVGKMRSFFSYKVHGAVACRIGPLSENHAGRRAMAPTMKSIVAGTIARAFLLICLCVAGVAQAQALDAPEKAINGLNAKLLDTMKQAQQLGVQGRYDALAPVLSKTYDIASMTRMAVGQSWDSLQPAQKAALTQAFSRMMIATYAKRFDGFSGETFQIVEITDRAPS